MKIFQLHTPATKNIAGPQAASVGTRAPMLQPMVGGLQDFVRGVSLAVVLDAWVTLYPDAIATVYSDYVDRGDEITVTLLIHSPQLKTDELLGEIFPADQYAGDDV